MIALACTALVLTTLLYVGWRYERVVRERDDRAFALKELEATERTAALECEAMERTAAEERERAQRLALEERKVALQEREMVERIRIEERKVAALEAEVAKEAEPPVEIPDGLLALAAAESEEWAQEHVKARIRELYVELGDWNKVGDAIAQELAS